MHGSDGTGNFKCHIATWLYENTTNPFIVNYIVM